MATIKDVAKEAGVAVETVSRVLNNRGYISAKTRNKVYLAMEELNYRPNEFAQGLSRKDMRMIAVVVPHISHPYFAQVISSLEKESAGRGYKLLLYNSGINEQKEKLVMEMCQSSFINGVVLFSHDIPAEEIMKYHVPTVMFERFMEKGAGSVRCDNAMGGRLAAGHLLERGCRRLVVIGSELDDDMPAISREDAFLKECAAAGAQCRVYKSRPEAYLEISYGTFLCQILKENPDCDGVFATSDVIAAQFLQESRKDGRRIPEDIRLVGFDDTMIAEMTTPTLTSIHQPVREMAAAALDIIARWNEGLTDEQRNLTFPVRLEERESTAV